MSELEKLRAEKARLEAEREAAKTAHDRVKEDLREFIDESFEFKVHAWSRLLREQGVDPNGHRIGMWYWDDSARILPIPRYRLTMVYNDRKMPRQQKKLRPTAANLIIYTGAAFLLYLMIALAVM